MKSHNQPGHFYWPCLISFLLSYKNLVAVVIEYTPTFPSFFFFHYSNTIPPSFHRPQLKALQDTPGHKFTLVIPTYYAFSKSKAESIHKPLLPHPPLARTYLIVAGNYKFSNNGGELLVDFFFKFLPSFGEMLQPSFYIFFFTSVGSLLNILCLDGFCVLILYLYFLFYFEQPELNLFYRRNFLRKCFFLSPDFYCVCLQHMRTYQQGRACFFIW